jgi:hypothetical protein
LTILLQAPIALLAEEISDLDFIDHIAASACGKEQLNEFLLSRIVVPAGHLSKSENKYTTITAAVTATTAHIARSPSNEGPAPNKCARYRRLIQPCLHVANECLPSVAFGGLMRHSPTASHEIVQNPGETDQTEVNPEREQGVDPWRRLALGTRGVEFITDHLEFPGVIAWESATADRDMHAGRV